MMLEILKVPEKKLRLISDPVNPLDQEIRELALDLEETLKKHKDPEGVGLSAPQVGKNLRLFTMAIDKNPLTYFNPEVLDASDDKTLGGKSDRPVLEGCLSIPYLYGPVWRAKKIKIKAQDAHGEEFTKIMTSFKARVFLHELDHLDGILFTDYTLKENHPLYLLQEDQFVEIQDPSSLIKW